MSDEARKFLNNYGDFVTKVTSEPSLDQNSLDARMKEIDSSSPIESARLLTAALGLGSETGEFVEIVKKIFLQGKPASEDNIYHMKTRRAGKQLSSMSTHQKSSKKNWKRLPSIAVSAWRTKSSIDDSRGENYV